jgi:hypothetical protein
MSISHIPLVNFVTTLWLHEGENMVKYIEKVVEKNQVKKKVFFHENTRK